MRESFKVNADEYRFIEKYKRINQKFQNKEPLTDEDYTFLLPKDEASIFKSAKLREQDLNKENMEYQRKVQLRRNEMQLRQLEREKEFKQEQISKKILLETHEGFTKKIKPAYFLENEIDMIDVKIYELREQNENIEKEQNVHRNKTIF